MLCVQLLRNTIGNELVGMYGQHNYNNNGPNCTTMKTTVAMPYSILYNHLHMDFVDGLVTMMGGGDAATGTGLAIHIYTANTSMKEKVTNYRVKQSLLLS